MLKRPWFWKDINIISVILYPLSFLYSLISKCRYILQIPMNLDSYIICIGNVTVGGSGKTPLAIAIGKLLLANKYTIAYACKNYASRIKKQTQVLPSHQTPDILDEAILLSKTAPSFVANTRKDALKAANGTAEIVITDDGFQNNAIHKDLAILAIPEDKNFGNGFIIPAGPLRESLESGLKKADLVCMIDELKDSHKHLRIIVEKYFAKEKIFRATKKYEFHGPRKEKYIAFCSIASPANFFQALKNHKINLIDEIDYPDHWHYSEKSLNILLNKAKKLNAGLITTEKDFVKLSKDFQKHVACLKLKFEISNKKILLSKMSFLR